MNATIIDLENSIWDRSYNTQNQIMNKTVLFNSTWKSHICAADVFGDNLCAEGKSPLGV